VCNVALLGGSGACVAALQTSVSLHVDATDSRELNFFLRYRDLQWHNV
jgi:hypothetical protein